ncbi:hypothetical protein [Luteibacter yeojuensis]|uniref:Uncharacterized protein n=1 Tax=Luteibacter yeojuensis TaxID=345309 RepID=A0A0F3L1F6_9GAMM|nr:hypothetical protein [Luteibacter yeojuensis]KJV37375.1 hypothetical protein VI08_00770 [Luteibacter yeojuensis]
MSWTIAFAELPHAAASVGRVDRIHATVAARDEQATVDIITSYPTLRPHLAVDADEVTAAG